ncbi:MAG TPA: hypothetical protein VMY79_02145 [Dehalococcoidia bacterium]|nr:hypothetical protein [Dehalococcoidia bacterium]
MSKIKEKDVEERRKVIEEEFPNDPALQHVHLARKIIAKEARLEGLSFLGYIKSPGKQREIAPGLNFFNRLQVTHPDRSANVVGVPGCPPPLAYGKLN